MRRKIEEISDLLESRDPLSFHRNQVSVDRKRKRMVLSQQRLSLKFFYTSSTTVVFLMMIVFLLQDISKSKAYLYNKPFIPTKGSYYSNRNQGKFKERKNFVSTPLQRNSWISFDSISLSPRDFVT